MKRKIINKKFFKLCGGYQTNIDVSFINAPTPKMNNLIKQKCKYYLSIDKYNNANNKPILEWHENYDNFNNRRNYLRSEQNTIINLIEQKQAIEDKYKSISKLPKELLWGKFLIEEEEINNSAYNSLANAIISPTKLSIEKLNLSGEINNEESLLLILIFLRLTLIFFFPNILEKEFKLEIINSPYKSLEMLMGNFRHIIFYLVKSRPTLKDQYIKENTINFIEKCEPYFRNSIIDKNNILKLFKNLNLPGLD